MKIPANETPEDRAVRLEHQRAYDRQYYARHRDHILERQRAWHKTEKGQAAIQRAYEMKKLLRQLDRLDPLTRLAIKLNTYEKKHPTMHKTPTSRTGRPAWLRAFLQEQGIDMKTMRQISRLLAHKREAERGLAEISRALSGPEAKLAASAVKSSVAAASKE
jgi:hypothetical protein